MRNDNKTTTKQGILSYLEDIATLMQEHFIVFSLDSAHRLIAKRTVFIGTLTSCPVHPREVFSEPLKDLAKSIIIAHNHPSGDVQPSDADIEMTEQLFAGGLLLGVHLEDHIIVSGKEHFSFLEQGLIFAPDLITEREGRLR